MTWEQMLEIRFSSVDKIDWKFAAQQICQNDSGSNSSLEYEMAKVILKLIDKVNRNT